MRVSYNRRGRIRGYSGGAGTYDWFQILSRAFTFLIVVPILAVLLAATLVCLVGWGIAQAANRPSAAAWKRSTTSVWAVVGRFVRWGRRQQS